MVLHEVLRPQEHPDEVGEPVALLVHQAGVGVHVHLEGGGHYESRKGKQRKGVGG